MSYQNIVQGLHERFATLSALKVVLDYEPTSIQDSPLLYSILDGFTRQVQGTHVRTTYRTLHRLCIRWQDPAIAEEMVEQLVDAIPEVLEADPRLGARVRPGDAQIVRGEAGWARIGETTVRIIDFYSEVIELSAYRGMGG